MSNVAAAVLQPRKTPVQARSIASVEATLDAAIQVLLLVGKERLTTTRVAVRAGVSVGTLYQYFPNKSALLQAALQRHVDAVTEVLERACLELRGRTLATMAEGLIDAYLAAKMRNVQESATLYAVSSDLDGMAIRKKASVRSLRALTEMFATAQEGLTKDPALVASMVLSAVNGTVRRALEERSPESAMKASRAELAVLVQAYLRTCAAAAPGVEPLPAH